MATGNKSKKSDANSNKNKQRYRPHNKAVKKGSYPLRPGVQGFFITCDGGRERQASQEAINVLDSFCEELVDGKASGVGSGQRLPDKPSNKKIIFSYSDSSSSDDDNDGDDVKKAKEEGEDKSGADASNDASNDASHENSSALNSDVNEQGEKHDSNEKEASHDENKEVHEEEAPTKKQCLEDDVLKRQSAAGNNVEEASVDRLIEAELRELGDKSKRRFIYLNSGCNGVVFVQMKKKDGDPSPTEIVQHMLTSIASTKRHVSRFILRLLPVEVSCYASEEDITRAIAPVISLHFPAESQTIHKFAVLYDARANTGVDKMKIINAVAKSVPAPHKVDLSNPDKNIVVQVVKTVCLIGVVEKYKELAKYNLRQLTSPPEP